MIKVLIIDTVTFHINGMSNVIMDYYRYTKEKVNYDFVINDCIDECYQKELKQNGENIFILKNRNKNPFNYIFKLSKIIKSGNYDIVHIHGNSALMLIELLACKKSAIDVVKIVHGHNTDCTHRKMHRLLYNYFIKNYDYGIACSKAAGEFLYGSHKHIVLNNGIQEEQYQFDSALRTLEREKKHISPNKKVLLHVGRFNNQKNHTFLIDIFQEVLKYEPNAVLRLVGTGKLFKEIKKKVFNLGIQDKVQFVGVTTHPEIEYNIADLFVMTSLFESFGLVTVEAQCSGLPCVLSDTIPKDISITDQVSFMSLQQSAKEWANEIIWMLNCNYQRKSHNQEVIQHGYSMKHIADKLAELYREVLGKRET